MAIRGTKFKPFHTQSNMYTREPIFSDVPHSRNQFANTKNIGIDGIVDKLINEVGTLRPSRYEVTVVIPSIVLNVLDPYYRDTGINSRIIEERLTLNCESVSMPGRGVSTTPNRIYGPVREMPHERLYSGDLDITFRMGQDMLERRVFEMWLDSIVNPHSDNFTYFNDYKSTVTISQLDEKNDIKYMMELFIYLLM